MSDEGASATFRHLLTIPQKLRHSILEKSEFFAYVRFNKTCKTIRKDCCRLKRRIWAGRTILDVNKKGILSNLHETVEHFEAHAFRPSFIITRIKPTTPVIRQEFLSKLRERRVICPWLFFYEKFEKMPLEEIREYIRTSNVQEVTFTGKLKKYKLTDFNMDDMEYVLRIDNYGHLVPDQDFLNFRHSICISGHPFSPDTITKKLELFQQETQLGEHFYLQQQGPFPTGLLDKFEEIGAQKRVDSTSPEDCDPEHPFTWTTGTFWGHYYVWELDCGDTDRKVEIRMRQRYEQSHDIHVQIVRNEE